MLVETLRNKNDNEQRKSPKTSKNATVVRGLRCRRTRRRLLMLREKAWLLQPDAVGGFSITFLSRKMFLAMCLFCGKLKEIPAEMGLAGRAEQRRNLDDNAERARLPNGDGR